MVRTRNVQLLIVGLIGSGVMTPCVALAQQAGASAQGAAAASQSDTAAQPQVGTEEILVTARRSAESQQKVPISITTFTTQKLVDLNVRDIRDLQSVTPGLMVAQASSGVRMSLRGQTEVDSGITGARSVGVYVDGVSLDQVYGLNQSLIDVARVEVLKGPQGTLFGKNTTGGAINITTQHPVYEWSGYADFLYGNYNNAQALAVVNAPLIDERLAVRFAGQIISREGFYREFNGRKSASDDSRYARLLIRADPTRNVELLLSGDYLSTHNSAQHFAITSEQMLATQNSATGWLGSIAAQLGLNAASAADRLTAYNAYKVYADQSIADVRKGFSNLAGAGEDIEVYTLSATLKVKLGGVDLDSITSFRHISRAYDVDVDNTPFDLFVQRQRQRDSNFAQELRLSSIDSEGLDWQIGGYYNSERGNDWVAQDSLFYVNGNRTLITESGVRASSKAAYGQAIYNFGSQFRITGGLRYTRDDRTLIAKNRTDLSLALAPLPAGGTSRCNLLLPSLGGPTFPNCSTAASTNSSKLTFLVSTDWRPTNNLMLYGLVSTGYRAGAFTPPGNSSPITSVAANTAAFTPYKPETLTNYEAGFKSDLLDRRLRVNLSAFYQNYNNVHARIRDLVNGVLVQITRNAAKATLYGGELEVSARPVPALSLNGSVGYLHAKYNNYVTLNTSGQPVDLSAQPFPTPKWTYNLDGTYEHRLDAGTLRFTLGYAYRSNTYYAPGTLPADSVSQPGFGLLNGRISLHLDGPDLDIAIFGKNLTDKRYRSYAFTLGAENVALAGDPRTYGVQVRKTF